MIMKFCLIPHFFLGLYMYSNSSILTPTYIRTNIEDFIKSSSAYFNSDRFSNVHTIIFIASIFFFFLLYILRYTLFSLLSRLSNLCKGLKAKMESQEVVSDDFYRDLSVMQLCKEFNKTTKERKEYEVIMRGGQFRKGVEQEMKLYGQKIDKKISAIEECFKELFIKHNIQYDDLDTKGGNQRRRHLISAIGELLKQKDQIMKADQRLKSTIYSYDLADNDYYQGLLQVEE